MKIGMISQWYEPETGSAAHPTAIARALQSAGHDVKVLTGFPNYPEGRIYDGYRVRPVQREVRDGVALHRVPIYPSHDASAMRRAITLSSFVVSAATQVSALRATDACVVYLTPATAGIPAILLKALARVPFVPYVQDLWPDSVLASDFLHGKASVAAERTLRAMCRTIYRHADSIAVISPGMKDVLIDRGVPAAKIHVVLNWVDESVFAPAEPQASMRESLGPSRFWLMYAGGLGDVQGLETAVSAIDELRSSHDVGLVFVGHGVAESRLKRMVADLDIQDRVRFLGSKSLSAMPGTIASADAQLVSLRDMPLFRSTIPSKVQAAMACGAPLIVSAPGDAAEVVNEAGAGIACRPEDPSSLARAIATMAELSPARRNSMGNAGRRFYHRFMSERVGTEAILSLLGRAAKVSRRVGTKVLDE